MKDFRCINCNRLLAKLEGKAQIKCPRCGTINQAFKTSEMEYVINVWSPKDGHFWTICMPTLEGLERKAQQFINDHDLGEPQIMQLWEQIRKKYKGESPDGRTGKNLSSR